MFDLGIMSKNLFHYNLESYTEKFYNKFTYKKWLKLYFFLTTVFSLDPNKHYRPNDLNNIISNTIKNAISNSRTFDTISDEQLMSLKKEGNLISPRDLSELLQIMVRDLKMLENIKGAKNIKKINYFHPGRKDNGVTKYEGFHSEYKLSNDFITEKKIFTGPGIILLKNFITKNQLVRYHFIFILNTICYTSSKIINKKITLQQKKRLKNEIINKKNKFAGR